MRNAGSNRVPAPGPVQITLSGFGKPTSRPFCPLLAECSRLACSKTVVQMVVILANRRCRPRCTNGLEWDALGRSELSISR
jgi:hypothetical protein